MQSYNVAVMVVFCFMMSNLCCSEQLSPSEQDFKKEYEWLKGENQVLSALIQRLERARQKRTSKKMGRKKLIRNAKLSLNGDKYTPKPISKPSKNTKSVTWKVPVTEEQ